MNVRERTRKREGAGTQKLGMHSACPMPCQTSSLRIMRARPSLSTQLIAADAPRLDPTAPLAQSTGAAGERTRPLPLARRRADDAAIRQQAVDSVFRAETAGEAPGIGALPVAIVPLQQRSIVALPQETRQRFLDRLSLRIARAYDDERDVPDGDRTDRSAPNHIAAILASSCALCRGACCTRGSDHAFLAEDSLARVRLENPAYSSDSLRDQYEASLPSHHFELSCVYHAATGCALPMLLRSTTCNRYRCGGLTQLHRALQHSGAPRAIVGASEGTALRELAVIDPRETRALAILPRANA